MVSLTARECVAANAAGIEESAFFGRIEGPLDPHRIGWIIAGTCTVIATLISIISVYLHARHYYKPREQRQILRILWMPAIYSIISFFSYRYFRTYTYYHLALVVYESIVITAFLMLLLQYIGDSTQDQRDALMNKEKRKIPFPLCCIRFRPSKPYFLHALKWSVLQYSLFRPLISVAGVVTEYYHVLCPTGYSIYFAAIYLDAFDFISISIALYGMIVFYALVRDRLKGRSPLIKFLAIKGIIFIAFYQRFVFGILADYNILKPTTYWTASNVADGLQALCICIEMVIFALIFFYAFSSKEYRVMKPDGGKTNPFWPILDSFNYSDFVVDAYHGIVFLISFVSGRPGTRGATKSGLDIDRAFAGNLNDSEEVLHPPAVGKLRTWEEEMAYRSHSSLANTNHFPLPPTSTTFGRHDDPYSSLRGRRYSQDAGMEEMNHYDDRERTMGNSNRRASGAGESNGGSSRPESGGSAYGQISYGTAQ